MARTKQTAMRSTTGELAPRGQSRPSIIKTGLAAANTEHSNGSKNFPSKTMSTVDKRWVSQDLDLLQSGLFADAEIFCCDSSPRKVHRSILSARSDWFKKAFSGNYTERDGKVILQRRSFEVDLMLYFFYSGGIDMADNVLTGGHDVMAISIELLRLGNTFESKSMQDYGKDLLASYLGELLDHICDTKATGETKRLRFKKQADFPRQLCAAVRNAYHTGLPAKAAQGILADFTFAARIHLFKDKEFKPFITSNQVPEFGNLVLAAQMDGGISGAFQDNSTFKKCKRWETTPSKTRST